MPVLAGRWRITGRPLGDARCAGPARAKRRPRCAPRCASPRPGTATAALHRYRRCTAAASRGCADRPPRRGAREVAHDTPCDLSLTPPHVLCTPARKRRPAGAPSRDADARCAGASAMPHKGPCRGWGRRRPARRSALGLRAQAPFSLSSPCVPLTLASAREAAPWPRPHGPGQRALAGGARDDAQPDRSRRRSQCAWRVPGRAGVAGSAPASIRASGSRRVSFLSPCHACTRATVATLVLPVATSLSSWSRRAIGACVSVSEPRSLKTIFSGPWTVLRLMMSRMSAAASAP